SRIEHAARDRRQAPDADKGSHSHDARAHAVAETFRDSKDLRLVLERNLSASARDRPPELRRDLAEASARRRAGECHARPANSRVSLCTFTLSPSLMKSGTRICRPVSSVASFVTPPLAVSPRTPGSVSLTESSTCGGNCTPIGLPLYF